MNRFDARYFDGRSSSAQEVEVRVEGRQVLVCGPEMLLAYPLEALRFRPHIGRLPVAIELPGGALLQADLHAVSGVLALPPASGLARRLESHLGVVLVALAGLALAAWFGYRDGVPWLAREVAYRLPPSLESQIAEEGIKGLDRAVFKPSQLPAARRDALRTTFTSLSTEGKVGARLEFRDGGWVGANAFAIPGGVVVVTDQLVELLGDDDKVAAVLAHEVGHLRHRHGARHILQDSFVALGAMALLGDGSNVAQLATTLPTVMLHTTYSRDFEREADQYAFDLLKRTGRSPKLFGEALAKLEAEQFRDHGGSEGCHPPADVEAEKKGDAGEEKKPKRRSYDLGYLSTHPSTEERVKAAEEAAR